MPNTAKAPATANAATPAKDTTMTKDQMRALLASLVPAAEQRGDVYRVNRVGSGNAPGKPYDITYLSGVSPATNPQVQTRAPSKKHRAIYPGHRDLEVPTFKTFQAT